MGSATGRHRRPRQAPAIVVAAGVTGSAIAIPLLGAGGAQAADASTWDRVAECESGGIWSADLGNGYYGGLQLSEETWSAYGGASYAARADLASRSQQIAVAEKVLEAKGPQAWPSCSVISGLVLDGLLPGVDPGGELSAEATETATPSATPSAGTSDEAADVDAKGKAGKGASGAKTDKSDKTGKSGATSSPEAPEASEASGVSGDEGVKAGKHRGAPAPEAGGKSGAVEARESGRHASRGDSEAREAAQGTYTVQEGDNLWAIADTEELPGGWTALYEANKDEVGSDPDLILPGQSLDLGLGTGTGTGSGAETAPAETSAAN